MTCSCQIECCIETSSRNKEWSQHNDDTEDKDKVRFFHVCIYVERYVYFFQERLYIDMESIVSNGYNCKEIAKIAFFVQKTEFDAKPYRTV